MRRACFIEEDLWGMDIIPLGMTLGAFEEALPRRIETAMIEVDVKPIDPELAAVLAASAQRPNLHMLDVQGARETMRLLTEERIPLAPRIDTFDLQIVAEGSTLPARRFVPDSVADPRTVILYFHGGGYVIGSVETHDPFCRRLAAISGYEVVSVEYRLAPEHPYPSALNDGAAAARWASSPEIKNEFGWSRTLLGGDSAGANLAAWTAVEMVRQDLQCDGLLLIYPNVAFVHASPSRTALRDAPLVGARDIAYFAHHALGEAAEPSLLDQDLSQLPPTIVVTAGHDILRDEGRDLAAKIRTEAGDATLLDHPDMVHGFVNLAHLSGTVARHVDGIAAAVRTKFGGGAAPRIGRC